MTALCVGRDPEMWTPESDLARLAMAICRRCTGCPDNDPKPHGVIRRAVPYSNTGRPMSVCPTCGYPQPGDASHHPDRCPRCDLPALTRFAADLASWHAAGLTDRQAGARIGASSEQVRDTRRRYLKATTTHQPKEEAA